jgi:hypothetical protein
LGHDSRLPQTPLPPVHVWFAGAAALVASVLIVVLAATGALGDLMAGFGMRREDAAVVAGLLSTATIAGLLSGGGALLIGHGGRQLSGSGVAAIALGVGAVLGAVVVEGGSDWVLAIVGTLLIAVGVIGATLPRTRAANWWLMTSERRSAERIIAGLSGSRAARERVVGRGWPSLAGSIGVVVGVLLAMSLVVASVAPETVAESQAEAPGEAGPIPVDRGDFEYEPDLAELAQECADGELSSCDDLYLYADEFSDYEEYGTTCGGRATREYAGDCATQLN